METLSVYELSVPAEFYTEKTRWLLIEMLCTSGLLSKRLLHIPQLRTLRKTHRLTFKHLAIRRGASDYSQFASTLSKPGLSFSVEPLHSVSFKSETRNIRSVLFNTFGRPGRVDPSADGLMKQTFSIWLPQWPPLALVGFLYASFGSPMGSNLTRRLCCYC